MRPDLEREYVDYVTVRLPRLHRTAYLLCADTFQADDIVQATLTALYVSWKRASVADNLDGYVHRIMVRRYLDERRRSWSKVLLGDRVPDLAASADHGTEVRDELVTALRSLPKGQRAVVVLRYFGDLSVEATAEALGCSTGNVKSQCSRGLAALRTALDAGHPVATAETARNRS
ncbi:SigE family RNA polymerase sigma factor [Amorphoplanes digitatis]|uniref:RNA polymerase sigma-70 factor (Sigma-E family) n=1 Tax=Actinoplanes digitatis TaxID=1868 RepID=A0A7W7MNY5_9ACTN|nr:SigE family RNA polymerase sigma factor [Actinoplanes digitatis]MBB4760819.1 RNA polymerase sigma-70 factor (sigma-E family) [Actinoplanes digitatis]BFE69076.1 SigE family RNA polymerase sigma factor [Actinoplanes digitatis]GID97977.1 RNA polymerase sigma24 factor [Actinoplanes digitatis]